MIEILQILGALGVAFAAAWAIIAYRERVRCNRTEGGYSCHGENCEGCYRIIGGRVHYEHEQPANKWGDAPLTIWDN